MTITEFNMNMTWVQRYFISSLYTQGQQLCPCCTLCPWALPTFCPAWQKHPAKLGRSISALGGFHQGFGPHEGVRTRDATWKGSARYILCTDHTRNTKRGGEKWKKGTVYTLCSCLREWVKWVRPPLLYKGGMRLNWPPCGFQVVKSHFHVRTCYIVEE